jgi:malonyl-CoA O-methyltransferase
MPEPSDLDRSAVRRQFDRRSSHPAAADFLLREIEGRMLERLELIRLEPACVLDLGCGFGQGLAWLGERWPGATCIGIDQSVSRLARAQQRATPADPGWLRTLMGRFAPAPTMRPAARPLPVTYLAGDAHALPLASGSADLIWSNLMLHWLDDVPTAIAEWHRVIRPEGLLMFSALGVDTLAELRRAGAALPQWPDMHDIGDALVKSGFADPVMDTERLTITWRDARTLFTDLRALGGDARRTRPNGLVTPRRLDALLQALPARLSDVQGAPMPITFEVIYGHAWCASRKPRADGYAPIEFRPARPSARR